MEIKVTRFKAGDRATIGELFVDGEFYCYTLEDVIREVKDEPVESWKVKGKTAIPAGKYRVIVSMSNRFKRELPEVLNVPGFSGIRIHAGNTAADTEGCILPGLNYSDEAVTESRKAFQILFEAIKAAYENGERITIEIS